MALVNNLNGIKAILKIPLTTTTQDEQLNYLRHVAETVVKKYCKRDLELTNYTEYRDGTGTPDLWLRQRPVQSVAAVYMDPGGYYGDGPNAFPSTSLFRNGIDYALIRDGSNGEGNSGILKRLSGNPIASSIGWPWVWRAGTLTAMIPAVWTISIGGIKIMYSAGYDPANIPADLAHAVNQIVCYLRRTAPLGGLFLSQESLDKYSYSVAMPLLNSVPQLGETRQILSRYREFVC